MVANRPPAPYTFAFFALVLGMRMSVRSWSYPFVLSIAALLAAAAYVPTAEAAGDGQKGKTLAYTCLGCHGVPNYNNVYPTYKVPKLVGQHPEYIVAALKAYRTGERSHGTMHAHAASLTDQDMQDIATYLAGTPIATGGAGAQTVGTPPAAVATCQACHGRDGVGIMGIYPTLTGQHADYLEQSLRQYRTGARRNAIMAPFAAQLKPEELREVAEFFARQKPALKTADRPNSVFSAKK
jgi:cytochrome c553